MDKQKRCEITKDLLPLYADEICTDASREFVAEHLKECEDCRQELEDYRYNTGIPELGEEKEVFASFSKKMKRRNLKKIVVAVALCLAIVFLSAYLLFVPETVVEYSDGLMTAQVPEDGGIDVWVNLDNYKYVQSWEMKNEDGSFDIYLTAVQNNYTKIFAEKDKTDHLWRIGNWICVCFQSGMVNHLPGEKTEIKNIYYLEMEPEDVLYMTDEISFEDYETHLFWTNPDTSA